MPAPGCCMRKQPNLVPTASPELALRDVPKDSRDTCRGPTPRSNRLPPPATGPNAAPRRGRRGLPRRLATTGAGPSAVSTTRPRMANLRARLRPKGG